MYYLFHVSGPDGAVIKKVNSSNIMEWASSYTTTPVIKSLAVDLQEQNVYIATAANPIKVVVLYANDGTLYKILEFPNLSGYFDLTRIHPLSNGPGFYIIAIVATSGNTNKIYKYLFSDPANTQIQVIPNIIFFGYGQIMLSDTELIFYGVNSSSDLHFYKITFGSSFIDWGSKFLCSNPPCTLNPSESLLSADHSKLYAIAAYGQSEYLYIFVLKISDGSKVDTWYISNISNIVKVCGSALNGDYIAVSIAVTSGVSTYYLIIWNTSSGSFIFKQFLGTILN